MIIRLRNVALLFVLLTSSVVHGQIRFKHHFIDPDGPIGEAWGTNVIGDFDRAGHPEIVAIVQRDTQSGLDVFRAGSILNSQTTSQIPSD